VNDDLVLGKAATWDSPIGRLLAFLARPFAAGVGVMALTAIGCIALLIARRAAFMRRRPPILRQ
jgi:type IV secretory pathway VirB2 component (pilin)